MIYDFFWVNFCIRFEIRVEIPFLFHMNVELFHPSFVEKIILSNYIEFCLFLTWCTWYHGIIGHALCFSPGFFLLNRDWWGLPMFMLYVALNCFISLWYSIGLYENNHHAFIRSFVLLLIHIWAVSSTGGYEFHWTVSQSGSTSLHSYWHRVRIPVALPPCQHLALSVYAISVILVSVQ